ncbi:Clan CA, family C1, cathepsin L-like cysteine peptidase [Histomonas meleagridis]|uniref:Clan CA, family C1, cathepsin L-like cysteine peptidase n=1 Tax=Histomonas meleagridis TaxID=135588 RepID=UPI00355ABD26|nr:Clan CA, family C1, cathepsin L-like cysteine peptidase [Histomonas meleagridis]KAH0801811.1 Clan CA, family C1, cathepsin L-like cysteine peptidase [Histomonas meleagridis]
MLALVFLRYTLQSFAHEETSFLNWMKENSLCYTGEDYLKRLGIFITNKRAVQDFNKDHRFKLKLNQFAALTNSEYQNLIQSKYPFKMPENPITESHNSFTPDTLDWRDFGIVNPIRDFGSACAASWAFSAIASQESAWAKKHGDLYNLSTSNIIDCCIYSYGCNGGHPFDAFQYTNDYQSGQFMLESDYPYTGTQETCKFNASKAVTRSKNLVIVNLDDEKDMQSKCAEYGVMCASIDASSFAFQLYCSGIFDDDRCSKWQTNLAVCVVGYGVDGDVPYWILRNAWGTSWGEDGYMRLRRNKDSMCGIASMAFVPLAE